MKTLTNFSFSYMDAKIYLHGLGQFLDLSGRMGYRAQVGKRSQIQITFQDVVQLDYKNTQTGTFLSFFLSEKDKKCSHDTYDHCMYSTLAKYMKEETRDNCTVPWILDNQNICSNNSDIQKAFWISWNRITNQKKDCLSPCHATLINVGAKNNRKYTNKDSGRVDLYFSPHVMQSKEHYYYTVIKLFAQIGGYIGLFRLTLFLLDLFRCSKYRQEDKIIPKAKNKFIKKKRNPHEVMADDHLINLSTYALDTL